MLCVWLLELTDHLGSRLRQVGIQARTVELKLRSSDFRTRHKGQALPEATNLTEILWRTAREILERSLTRDLLPIRLLGVGATRLTRDRDAQGDLFEAGVRRRRQSLDQTIDAIRGQFGAKALRRGSLLDHAQENDVRPTGSPPNL